MVDSKFLGTFKYDACDNLEEYLKCTGAAFDCEKFAASTTIPTVTISVSDDGVWTTVYVGSPENHTSSFKLGEETEIEYMGQKIKHTTTLEGDKMFSVVTHANGKIENKTMVFTEEGYTSTMKVDDVVASMTFKRP